MQIYDKTTMNDAKPDTLKGEIGTLSLENLTVGVKIADVRMRFGHLDLLVKPLNGDGQQWVERHRVKVMS